MNETVNQHYNKAISEADKTDSAKDKEKEEKGKFACSFREEDDKELIEHLPPLMAFCEAVRKYGNIYCEILEEAKNDLAELFAYNDQVFQRDVPSGRASHVPMTPKKETNEVK